MRVLIVASLLMLASCNGAAEPQAESDPQEPVQERVAANSAPDSLAGSWRVVAIGGEALAEHEMVALQADEQEIWWEPRCTGFIRGYTLDGNAFETGARVTEPPASTSTPAPVCLVGRPARLYEIGQALQLARHIELTDAASDESVLISGDGPSLSLVATSD